MSPRRRGLLLNPYPPYPYPPQQQAYGTKPAVVTWYVVYAVFMAVVYLGAIGLGVLLASFAQKDEETIQGVIIAVVSLPFLVLFAVAPFRANTPGAWTYHLVLICLWLTSACCIPVSLPLLIYWLKPETKAYFGKM